jgi:hypothetical protein
MLTLCFKQLKGYLHVDAGSLKLLGFEHVRTVEAVSEVEFRVTVSDDVHV